MAVRRDERIYVQVCRNMPEESDREVDKEWGLPVHDDRKLFEMLLLNIDDASG